MASNQTSNYGLNQWEAGDRVMREEFNQDNLNIDSALANKLGRSQVLRTVITEESTQTISLMLDDVDWDQWGILALFIPYSGSGHDSSSQGGGEVSVLCSPNEGRVPCYSSGEGGSYFVKNHPAPFLLVLLPLHNGGGKVRGLCFGTSGSYCQAECTFHELTSLQIRLFSKSQYFPTGMELTLWGVK